MTALEEHRSIWRPPGLRGLRILKLERVARDWRGATDALAVSVHGRGTAEVTVGRRTTPLASGIITLCPPREPYLVRRHGATASLAFHIDVQQVAHHLGDASASRHLSRMPLWSGRQPRLREHLLALFRAVAEGAPVMALEEAMSRAAIALAQQVSKHSAPRVTREPGAVKRAREAIHDRLGEPLRLVELAALAGVSCSSLLRAFTRELGMSPHAYQTSLRVARAQSLIEAGVPLVETAAQVGFADQSHLNRYFRRLLGTTPARFARGGRASLDGAR
jgi:AraC-like DNA-binding protein